MPTGIYVRTEEHKRKIGLAGKGRKCSEETKQRMSLAAKGHIKSDEQRKKMSEIRKGKHFSPLTEFRKGQTSLNKGKHHTEETLSKLRYINRGEKSGMWRGGKKLYTARKRAKRRELGSIFINSPLVGTVGHHINMDCVVYIPLLIHKIPHNVRTGQNMDYVNSMTLLWLCFTEEINNIKTTST